MDLTTVFLAVLIFALLIGNAFLWLLGRQAKPGLGSLKAGIESAPRTAGAFDAQLPQEKTLVPVEKKIELAHRRIQELEQRLGNGSMRGFSDELMKRKVDRLENFKHTAESELIAIKEILVELQNRGITAKARTFKNGGQKEKEVSEKEVSGDEMHKIIYRSSS